MASIPELLGKRPRKYSFGEALGQALEGAGKHFNMLAVQKKNAEALEAARKHEADVRQQTWERQDEVRAEEREHATSLLEDERAYQEKQAASAADAGAFTETYVAEDGEARLGRFNRNGELVNDISRDPDYAKDAQGNTIRLSTGQVGVDQNERLTEAQTKFRLHASNMEQATAKMAELIGGEGYELRSWESLGDQVAQVFGSWGNWFTSKQGRQYQAFQKVAGESLYKAMSGAAGSDAEAQRFYTMFPQPGDDGETIQTKLTMIDEITRNLNEASGKFAGDPEGLYSYMKTRVNLIQADHGFDDDTGGFIGSGASQAAAPGALDLQGLVRDGVLSEEDAAYLEAE